MLDTIETPVLPRKNSWALQLALCLLGPFFFLTIIFSLFAPLPTLYLHQGIENRKIGRIWSGLALFIGCVLCGFIKGKSGAFGFFLFASLPATILGELLAQKRGPELAIVGAVLAIIVSALTVSIGYAQLKGIALVPYAKTELRLSIQEMSKKLMDAQKSELATESQEELKKVTANPDLLVAELPGMGLSAIILLCAIPCLALIRWNPKGFLRRNSIPRDFLRKWKSPEWLVWPALLCLVFLIFEVDVVSSVANNIVKPILLIYFFQGMSILAFFLDSLRLRGPIRVIIYSLGIVFLTPMVVSFGFFDLWFNFRGRRKSDLNEEDEDI